MLNLEKKSLVMKMSQLVWNKKKEKRTQLNNAYNDNWTTIPLAVVGEV